MTPDSTQRATVLGALAAAVVLLVAAPGPASLLRTLSDPGAASTPTAPLVALLTLVAWCLAAYLLTIAGLTAGSRLPGAAGRVLAGVGRRAAPAGLRRALELALGVTLVVGTVAGPAAAAAPSVPAAVTTVTDSRLPSLDHPVAPDVAPSLDHPTAATPAAAPTPSLDHPATAPAPVAPPPAPADPGLPTTGADQVLVQPGDSLWALAQERLGPQATDAQVAQAWPSWWQANRELVGDDPDLLQPGTPLTPPDQP